MENRMKLKYIITNTIILMSLGSPASQAETNGCAVNTYDLTNTIWKAHHGHFKHANERTPGRYRIEKILKESGYSVVTGKNKESDFSIY